MPTLTPPPPKPRRRHRKRDRYGRVITGPPIAGWAKFLLLLLVAVIVTFAFERFVNR